MSVCAAIVFVFFVSLLYRVRLSSIAQWSDWLSSDVLVQRCHLHSC